MGTQRSDRCAARAPCARDLGRRPHGRSRRTISLRRRSSSRANAPHRVSSPLHLLSVRTKTLPPATHTNCYLIYTSSEILIIDPGSPYEDEQGALAACVDDFIAKERNAREIILTHVHPD